MSKVYLSPMRGAIVTIPKMTETCKECGCNCNSCFNMNNSLDLHHEIEELRSQLRKSNNHISEMERDMEDNRQNSDQKMAKLQEELGKLRDRYDRLYESHKKLQRINHNLEDKLLQVVNKYECEKTSLQKDVASITSKLVDAKHTICDLEEESERYRNDCNMAVHLLQCKPSNFVAHKLNTLPLDLQQRVKSIMTREQIINMEDQPTTETKTIRVPMPTFPPTAMVYSINKVVVTPQDKDGRIENVPITLVAKVLSQPEPKRKPQRTYICNKCKMDIVFMEKGIQTEKMLNRDHNDSDLDLSMEKQQYSSGIMLAKPHVHKPHKTRLNSTETEI